MSLDVSSPLIPFQPVFSLATRTKFPTFQSKCSLVGGRTVAQPANARAITLRIAVGTPFECNLPHSAHRPFRLHLSTIPMRAALIHNPVWLISEYVDRHSTSPDFMRWR